MIQNSSDEGVAYIETGSLDGEKNLKPRNALQQIQTYIRNELKDDLSLFKASFQVALPNSELHSFNGVMLS